MNSDQDKEKQPSTEPDLPKDTTREEDTFEDIKNKCSILSITPVVDTIYDALIHGREIAEAQGDFWVRDGTRVEKVEDDPELQAQLVKKTDKGLAVVGLQNLEKFSGYNISNIKFLTHFIAEMNLQNVVVDGKLVKDYVDISIQRLVDLKIWNTRRAARRGFDINVDILSNIKMRGAIYTKGGNIVQSRMRVLVVGSDVDEPTDKDIDGKKKKRKRKPKGRILLNNRPGVEWGLMTRFKAPFGNCYFALSTKAGILLLQIIAYARIGRTRLLARKKHNFFRIPFESIRGKLGLPKPSETTTPGRSIRTVILDAIKEINGKLQEELKNNDIELLAQHDYCRDLQKCPIEDFLTHGFLRVKMKGRFFEYFKHVGGVKNRKKSASNKNAEDKRVEDAKTIHPQVADA